MKNISTIILAAGKGTRMKSQKLKVLHPVGGKTLIEHSVGIAYKIKSQDVTIVVPGGEANELTSLRAHELTKVLEKSTERLAIKIDQAVQDKQLGSGHALKCGLGASKIKSGTVVVLNADMPFVQPKSIQRLINSCHQKKAVMGLLSVKIDGPSSFGRILRDEQGSVLAIVENKGATREQKKITEFNMGIYVFDEKFLNASIGKLKTNNKQKEYYLTDLVKIAVKSKKKVVAHIVSDAVEGLGVNSQVELNQLNQIFYKRQRERFMQDGVTMIGDDIYIDADVKIAGGVRLESPCYLKGQTSIGSGTVIEGGCVLRCAHLGENVLIKSHCYLTEAVVENLCEVGPFAHLRPGTKLASKVRIGNFVETKKAEFGEGCKANHLSYIGDAVLGKNVNVGAGTITCNYDGFHKFQTILEDGVFIGSDTQLVAPVTVGQGAYVGAGTTVTKDVKPDSLVISRVHQKEISGWAIKHRQKNNP